MLCSISAKPEAKTDPAETRTRISVINKALPHEDNNPFFIPFPPEFNKNYRLRRVTYLKNQCQEDFLRYIFHFKLMIKMMLMEKIAENAKISDNLTGGTGIVRNK